MYKEESEDQQKLEDFYLPFGGHLNPKNRWVVLSKKIPWDRLESGYAKQFSSTGMGAPVKPFRMALGSLIIKEKFQITDEETVDQIQEMPYLQYFIGLEGYSYEPPFDSSLIVHFQKQLNYLRGDIKHIERMLERGHTVEFPYKFIRKFLVIKELYMQQRQMYEKNERKVENRIVSVSQPHIRPIVRGKAGTPVEFGAKVSISLTNGFSFIDHLSWNSLNEADDLIPQIEKYKERYGYYPESVHADKIYQNRANRSFCKEHGIRITGKPLNQPPVETEENKDKLSAEKKQRYQDDVDRIAVEGCIVVTKRKYGLGLIKSKLLSTRETEICLSVFVMNLDKICSEELAVKRDKYKMVRDKAA